MVIEPSDTGRARGKLRALPGKLALALVSFSVCIAALELSLRFFYPRYQYAAESKFERDADRIWVRRERSSYERLHPDTGEPHTVHHNNLALRHHRDITESDLASAVNVGVFGDSFTENLRLPGPYVFTEVLDHLLNEHPGDYNVLNLGLDGYGTDQSYIHYREFEHSGHLDHVVYVFCVNDIRNIYENNLYSFDAERGLSVNPVAPSAWWVRLLGRLHATYFVADAMQRIRPGDEGEITDLEAFFQRKQRRRVRDDRFHDERADSVHRALRQGEESGDLERVVAIFQSLLRSWKTEVEASGGEFHVVLVPRLKEHESRALIPPAIEVIDLYEEFGALIEGYDYVDWRFDQDAHWNEAGNRLAATVLFRALESAMELPRLPDTALEDAVLTYYCSFGGWMPEGRPAWGGQDPDQGSAIRARYGPRMAQ